MRQQSCVPLFGATFKAKLAFVRKTAEVIRDGSLKIPEATRYTTFIALGASRKPQEMWKELAEVRGTQPGDRVPASRRREALSAAARVRAAPDVVERTGELVQLIGQSMRRRNATPITKRYDALQDSPTPPALFRSPAVHR